ncbi:hypothetical protein KKE88_01450, partial [Patescibacteria group bacterium]|nr:hypothetical protein [Patescibacteria group bacterium]
AVSRNQDIFNCKDQHKKTNPPYPPFGFANFNTQKYIYNAFFCLRLTYLILQKKSISLLYFFPNML